MSQPQNKFIIGYSVVSVLGAGILGYLCYSAKSTQEEAQNSLTSQQGKLNTLKTAALFPKQENVDAKREQVSKFSSEVDKLHTALIAYQTPLDTETAPDKVTVKFGEFKSRLELIAKGRGIKLPADFNLGMTRYLTGAPIKEAAPQINYLGTSVNTLLTILFNHGISSLDDISCPEMPYEKDTTQVVAPVPKKKPAASSKKDAAKVAPKVEAPVLNENAVFNRYKINLRFTGSEKAVQEALNEIATLPDTQGGPFFVINLLRVENEVSIGPAKDQTVTPTPIPPDPNNPTATSTGVIDSKFIVGNEKISVGLDLDLLRFFDVPSAAEPESPAVK